MRNPRFLLYVALILAVLNLLHTVDASPRQYLVRADFQRCVTIHSEPLIVHRSITGEPPQADVT